ncbi:MAG: hypothetical protein HOD92_08235 [Deltaproteobacteria bacterium]|jgi:hypothetical protein|nr:hypothetical protein [Deltaproteobacteria bacterium]
MSRGGKRKGAGRKRSPDPTIIIRVPKSKVILIKEWLKMESPFVRQSDKPEGKITDCEILLNQALKLKANAGGKIKTEIRKALELLQSL